MKNSFRSFTLILLFFLPLMWGFKQASTFQKADQTKPIITHITNPAMPGKLSVITGFGWDMEAPEFKACKLANTQKGNPGVPVEFKSKTAQDIKIVKIVNKKEILIKTTKIINIFKL